MRLRQVDEIGPHAARLLMERWHLDEHAATAALHDAARDLGVEVGDLAALVVAAAPHLHLVEGTPVEPVSRGSGDRIIYGRRERPPVEMRVDGAWSRGRLSAQIDSANGWRLYVLRDRPEDRTARLAEVAALDVRRATEPSPGQPNNPGPNGPDEPPPDNPSGLGGSSAA